MEKIPFLFTSVYLAASQKCCSLSVITLPVVSLLLWFSRQHILLCVCVCVFCIFLFVGLNPSHTSGTVPEAFEIRFDCSMWIDCCCTCCLFACNLFLYNANVLDWLERLLGSKSNIGTAVSFKVSAFAAMF